ncbi:hypothetical protein GBA52_004157 [Prunus armeniaca]|nr:hypothetical protein GBA52_004157 [Prunus armeniaca]
MGLGRKHTGRVEPDGWLARDSNGWMEMARGVGGFSCQSALATEVEAVREAVAVSLEARVTNVTQLLSGRKMFSLGRCEFSA